MNNIYIDGTNHISLVGNKYERLLVTSFSNRKTRKDNHGKNKYKYYYNCLCDCGNKCICNANSLKSGKSRSCGCLKSDKIKARRKLCSYTFTDNYVIGYCYNDNSEFYIDLEDYEDIKDFSWYRDYNTNYICTNNIDAKYGKLHRCIMDKYGDLTNKDVDHIITKDKHDNRKSNLRIITHQQNLFNTKLNKLNASGFTGVYWSKKDKSWYSQITYNKKCIHLGYTKTKEQALIQRLQAEVKYFGKDFAPQRHLFEEYGIITEL